MELHYVAKEPGSFSKLVNGYWLKTVKSKWLKEFKVDGERLYVSVMDGTELTAALSECSIFYQIEEKMMEVEIEKGDRKIEFWEHGFMEDDDDWKGVRIFIEGHRTELFHFVTHEPKWWQKLMQSYYLMPKSRLLREIRYDGTNLYVSTMTDKVISAPLSECTFQHDYDGAKRMEVIIKNGDNKLRFRQMPFMLDDVEWGTVKHFVLDTCHSQMSKVSKIAHGVTKVLEDLKD